MYFGSESRIFQNNVVLVSETAVALLMDSEQQTIYILQHSGGNADIAARLEMEDFLALHQQ